MQFSKENSTYFRMHINALQYIIDEEMRCQLQKLQLAFLIDKICTIHNTTSPNCMTHNTGWLRLQSLREKKRVYCL